MKQKHLYLLVIVVVASIALFLLGNYITGRFVNPGGDGGNGGNSGGEVDKVAQFAQCLTDKGVVMYGSASCGHCANQKEMFGDAFQYVTYVECTEQQSVCNQKGVQYVPAWEIDGTLYVGEKSFFELSRMSGCPFE